MEEFVFWSWTMQFHCSKKNIKNTTSWHKTVFCHENDKPPWQTIYNIWNLGSRRFWARVFTTLWPPNQGEHLDRLCLICVIYVWYMSCMFHMCHRGVTCVIYVYSVTSRIFILLFLLCDIQDVKYTRTLWLPSLLLILYQKVNSNCLAVY